MLHNCGCSTRGEAEEFPIANPIGSAGHAPTGREYHFLPVRETEMGMNEESKTGVSYRDAGVDIDAQDVALERIKTMVASTTTPGTLSELGSFGGLFSLEKAGWDRPILVSSCDGVGTKLKVAFLSGIHHTVGRDLVNHCINDILVQGAEPLFFMDYVATGKLDPAVLAEVVRGVSNGCREAGCALLGGETAEMPGFYSDDEYDIAGFVVGAVNPDQLLDGSRVAVGDRLIAMPSAGLHTNGYSLARKVFFELLGLQSDSRVEELDATVSEVLLREHRSYLQALRVPVRSGWVSGLAHITGGGLTDNLPRVLPEGTAAQVDRSTWTPSSEFLFLQKHGKVTEDEMFRAFNMGVGMVAFVAQDQLASFTAHLDSVKESWFDLGEVIEGVAGEPGRTVYV
jgi:phosphoribosylformylglycinamidine cyclo-ligase